MSLTASRLFLRRSPTSLPLASAAPGSCSPRRSFHAPAFLSISPGFRTSSPAHLRASQWLAHRNARALHTSTPRHNAAQGLTNMLAGEVPPPVQVLSVGPGGITLADGLVLRGPAVFLEGRVWLWDVPAAKRSNGEASWEGWNEDCFKLFEVVVPRPEILILGTGEKMSLFPPALRKYLNGLGIQVDVMDTRNACSTYNLLAEEGRHVAAAVLPPNPVPWRSSQ